MMRVVEAEAGDSIRVVAENVIHADDGEVTSGLVGAVTLRDADGDVVDGPITMSVSAGSNDWYADVTIPDVPGLYIASIVTVVNGAQKTVPIGIQVSA
jgi:hypothetical protein